MADVLADGRATLDEVIRPTETAGIDVAPANIDLACTENELFSASAASRSCARRSTAARRARYDYILIDCPPTLGLLTINGLVAADGVIIPVQTQYYALKGLTALVKVINTIRTKLNRDLRDPRPAADVLRRPHDPRPRHARRAARARRPPRLRHHRPQHREARRGAAGRPADHVVRRQSGGGARRIADWRGR